MNPYYSAYPPQSLPQGANGLGGWQNSQPMGYPGLGSQNGYQQASAPALPGRVIRDIAEVRPNEVPNNGSPAIFLKDDMSCIYVKYLSNVGKIETMVFAPTTPETEAAPANAELEDIRQKLDELLKRTPKRTKPYHKPYRGDKKGEDHEPEPK